MPAIPSVERVPRFTNNASAAVTMTGASSRVSVIMGRSPAANKPAATSDMLTVAVRQWTITARRRAAAATSLTVMPPSPHR